MSKSLRFSLAGLTAALALALCAGPASAQITVGQVAPVNPELDCSSPSISWDELQVSLASGASYSVPSPGGVITSWSTSAGPGSGQLFELKVFRPTGGGSYQVVAHDGPRALTPSTVNTFAVSIPVQSGDIVGDHVVAGSSDTACYFGTPNALDITGWSFADHADGTTFSLEETEGGTRSNISAALLPPPTLTALAPAKGSIKGGTAVVLTGTNLAEVKGVSFGATPATFAVNSESQITATAPASSSLAAVPVTVTTVAGTASTPTTFQYLGCKVPNLGHKKLKAAKKALKKAGCKLGKAKLTGEATTKTGKVEKQKPKRGKLLAPGSKVNVTLG